MSKFFVPNALHVWGQCFSNLMLRTTKNERGRSRNCQLVINILEKNSVFEKKFSGKFLLVFLNFQPEMQKGKLQFFCRRNFFSKKIGFSDFGFLK